MTIGGSSRHRFGRSILCGTLALLTATASVPAQTFDVGYAVGGGDWVLEQFGSDVAILRNSAGAGEIAVLMSCAGPERRLRLSLPGPAFAPPGESFGSVQITPFGSRTSGLALIASFTMTDPHTMALETRPSSRQDSVAAIGRMMLTRPRALDMLVSWGPGLVRFTRLMSYRLLLSLTSATVSSIGHFLTACETPVPRQAD